MANIYKMDNDYLSAESVYDRTTGKTQSELNGTFVRPNLLDNWYFAGNGSQNGNFPINQRGQEYYTNAGVTIDRWFKATDGAINAITKAYGLIVTPNTTLYQKLSTDTKDALDGKTCTLTLLTNDEEIKSGTFVYKSAPSSTITILNVAGLVKFECGIDGNIYITWLAYYNRGYFAIKLELGDTQTLAHQEGNTWVLNEIPNYAEELAKCQRFFQMFRTQALRPTYGADCRPVMASETPTAGTITSGSVTYYTLSSEQ